jgi:hypothetical protein
MDEATLVGLLVGGCAAAALLPASRRERFLVACGWACFALVLARFG